jgi:broad-specificity NMP kinase
VSRATGFTPFRLLFGTEAMMPEEIENESMRVLKAKEIEEVDQKVEKDMIELTILEAAENIISRSTKKRPRHGKIRKWSERTSKLAIWC